MDLFSNDRLLDDLLNLDELLDSLDDDLLDLLYHLFGSSVALLTKIGVVEEDLSFGIFGIEFHFCSTFLGGHSGLGEKLGDHGAGLLDLVALLLEGGLHVLDSSGEFGGFHFIELLDPFRDIFEIIRTFGMLGATVLELFLKLGWVKFVCEKTLHLVFGDVFGLLWLTSGGHGIQDGVCSGFLSKHKKILKDT